VKYNELMNKTLNGMLGVGESLYYPVYGVLNEGVYQSYAFFGLTETHLLIATVCGNNITETKCVPLKIKSVTTRRTAVFREYFIDILFEDGWSCTLTCPKKVLMIESQKENIPKFLEYLLSRAPVIHDKKLSELDGKTIRVQYFNMFLYVFAMVITMFCLSQLIMGTFFKNVIDIIIPIVVIMGPFLLLSVLNRLFFGKTLAVARDDALVVENRVIPWHTIEKIEYTPNNLSKYNKRPCIAVIHFEGKTVTLEHFPLYGVRLIKSYNRDIKFELTKDGKKTIAFAIAAAVIGGVIIPYI